MRIFGFIILIFLSVYSNGQSTPSNFIFSTTPATNSSYTVNGYGADYSSGTSFNVFFGYSSAGNPSNDYKLQSFDVGATTYNPITLPNGECYSRVVVNRVVNPEVSDLDKQTLFFERGSRSGNNAFFTPTYTSIQEAVNTRILNRGGDNVFSNEDGQTLNNIERIDLIIDGGVFTPDNTQAGFLINERGGNDEFIVAAITGLDGSGDVAAIGNLVLIQISDWGNTGYSIASTVFQRGSADTYMRPNQDLTAQNVESVFINYADLGISNYDVIYGIVVFPADVNVSMDLIHLSDVPLNTTANSNDAGGLDLMGGGGYFASNSVIVTDLQVNITANNMSPEELDTIEITVRVDNNGPLADNDIVVTTTIPSGFSFVNIISGYEGNMTVVGNTITWEFSSLDLNEFESFTFKVVVEPTGDRVFTSSVTGTITDVVPGNNNDELELLPDSEQQTLPVNLVSLEGNYNNNAILIKWHTASEVNNHFFMVQRLINQYEYETIGVVYGHGNSNIIQSYSFTDFNPNNGINYYRLVQVDFDGKKSTSSQISVLVKQSSNPNLVFPNPFLETVSLLNFNNNSTVRIYSLSGEMLKEIINPTSNKVDLSNLSNGIYLLEIENFGERFLQKIVKQ